jgi:hypothetical protein
MTDYSQAGWYDGEPYGDGWDDDLAHAVEGL